MHVDVNETRGHHQPLGVDCCAPPQWIGAHHGDLAAADCNVPHGLQVGLRVDHGAADQDDVVGRLLRHGLGASPNQCRHRSRSSDEQENGAPAQRNVVHGRIGGDLDGLVDLNRT